MASSLTASNLAERLAVLASWVDGASLLLVREVHDSRRHHPVNFDDIDPEHRVESITFLTTELDTVVTGFRCAADMLMALTAAMPTPISPVQAPPRRSGAKRSHAYLRVVE
jgi:hypothetical protein